MRVRAACASAIELARSAHRTATPSGSSAISSSAPSTWASCGSTPAIGSRNSPSRSNSRTTSAPMPDARTEIDDFDRDAAADAIQSPDALLHGRRLPRQVVEHQAVAELEVAPLAARFGRHQHARPIGCAEPRDLGVAPRRRQLLVEDAARELRPRAERVAQHLQRLAMRHEHQRLLVRPPPARRLRQQPLEARIGRDPSRPPAAAARSRRARAPPSAPRRTRALGECDPALAVGATASWRGHSRSDRRAALRRLSRSCRSLARTASVGRSIATGARGGRPPISTRRVELVHGGSGTPDASRASTSFPSGNSSGRSSCSSRKNPCASSSSGVALSSST